MGLYDNLGDKLFYTRGILHYIAGDFNAPDIDWDNLCCLRDSGDKCLMDFAVTNGFSQVVTKPTRLNNKLDIV